MVSARQRGSAGELETPPAVLVLPCLDHGSTAALVLLARHGSGTATEGSVTITRGCPSVLGGPRLANNLLSLPNQKVL